MQRRTIKRVSIRLANFKSVNQPQKNQCSTYRTSKQPRIRRRLIHIRPLRPIHLQHLKPAHRRIPMKNPLHARPSTPPHTPPTRLRSARTTLVHPDHVQIRPVHPRVSTARIPAPLRTGVGLRQLFLRHLRTRPHARSTPAIVIVLAAIQNTTSVSPPSYLAGRLELAA